MSVLRKFARRSRSEKRLLLRALFVVASIRAGLSVLPFRSLQRFVFRVFKKAEQSFSVEQYVWAVKATSRYVPRASCLTQALAAQYLLSRAGHSPRVEIGVAKNGNNQLQAHAWLVLGDQVVIGGIGVERYTPLTAWHEGN